MKRIAYIFFLLLAALVSSCANNYRSGENAISIRMKNGSQEKYKLLVVRDSSLVVFNSYEESKPDDAFSHAFVISFDSVEKIYSKGNSDLVFVAGALIGSAVGILIGYVSIPSTPQTFEGETPQPTDYSPLVTGGFIGFLTGLGVAYLVSNEDVTTFPINTRLKLSLQKDCILS